MDSLAGRVPGGGDAPASDESIRTLISAVLHEVRAPLSLLSANVDVMLGNLEEIKADEARAMLARMQRSTTWLQALIENLTTAAQLDAGQLYLALEVVTLGECVETAIALVQPVLERAGQVVEVAGDLALEARADRRRVEQVLVNLLANASRFGGDNVPIRLRVEPTGAMVRVWVDDRGPGVEPEEQKQIFERYRRGKAAEESGVGGLGLGLHVVKALIERQGGQVGVESSLGRGASFWVTLPRPGPASPKKGRGRR
jgi:signal transduction histidine kinase